MLGCDHINGQLRPPTRSVSPWPMKRMSASVKNFCATISMIGLSGRNRRCAS
jgi:hypothetical protein